MREFKILPTDERFLSLCPEQKEIIFEAYNYLPDNETISLVVGITKKKKEIEDKKPEDYVSGSVKKNMRKAFERMRMPEDKIVEAIYNQGKQARDVELAEINKQLNQVLGIKDPDANTKKRDELLKRRGEKLRAKAEKEKENGGKEK